MLAQCQGCRVESIADVAACAPSVKTPKSQMGRIRSPQTRRTVPSVFANNLVWLRHFKGVALASPVQSPPLASNSLLVILCLMSFLLTACQSAGTKPQPSPREFSEAEIKLRYAEHITALRCINEDYYELIERISKHENERDALVALEGVATFFESKPRDLLKNQGNKVIEKEVAEGLGPVAREAMLRLGLLNDFLGVCLDIVEFQERLALESEAQRFTGMISGHQRQLMSEVFPKCARLKVIVLREQRAFEHASEEVKNMERRREELEVLESDLARRSDDLQRRVRYELGDGKQ